MEGHSYAEGLDMMIDELLRVEMEVGGFDEACDVLNQSDCDIRDDH